MPLRPPTSARSRPLAGLLLAAMLPAAATVAAAATPPGPDGRLETAIAAAAAEPDLGTRLQRRLERWRELVPEDARRRRIMAEAAAVVDAAAAMLFGGPPQDPVLVVVTTDRRLAATLLGSAADGVGGRYVHADRILAVRDAGVSLRHELVHAMHFAHMERLGMRQPHPFWVQEGLATLFESWDPEAGEPADGPADIPRRFTANDRDPIARRLAEVRGIESLRELAAMDARTFMARGRRHYAVSRAVMRWLEAEGVLGAWYAALGNAADPDAGIEAMAASLDEPIAALDDRFRRWLLAETLPATGRVEGGAWLGVTRWNDAGAAGLEVRRMDRAIPRTDGQLRPGDLVVEIDGAIVAGEAELERLLARRRPGEAVRLLIRRRGELTPETVRLHAWRSAPEPRR
ncbi:MAG: PDZ domain-containing protein [Planctomycetota bacterium]